ncbi:MAG: hypothetical protein GSR83_03490, partial [Desulfurococcales archaeon]|nr:hypothetical protein [Desulfurococcales archaeon]
DVYKRQVEELASIAEAHGLKIDGYKDKDKLKNIAYCSGFHISLVLNTLRLEDLEKDKKGIIECDLERVVKESFNEREEIVNITRRFLTLIKLVQELAKINLAFLGILAQPMGISCLETKNFCSGILEKHSLSKQIYPLLPAGIKPKELVCDFSSIINIIEMHNWNDIMDVYNENWCSNTIIGIKTGTYFYHLPELISELERARTNEALKKIIKEYYKEQSRGQIKSLEVFADSMQFVRLKLLEAVKKVSNMDICREIKNHRDCLEGVEY